MLNITPELIIALAVMLLVAFPVHEFSHAFVAWRLGDGTAKLFGRLTLNPIVHFDPFGGTLLAVSMLLSNGAFGFGWAKPTPVNPVNLRGGNQGQALVALAGPASNLIMATIAGIVLRIVLATAPPYTNFWVTVVTALLILVELNILLCIFNLIPVPPLDGSSVLLGLVSPRTAWQIRSFYGEYSQYLFLALIFVLVVPIGSESLGARVIFPIIDGFTRFVVGY